MNQKDKKVIDWLSINVDLVISAVMLGCSIAVWNVVSVFTLAIGFHHLIHFMNSREIIRQEDLIDALCNTGKSQIECIEELANKLIPHLGEAAVLAILAKYQVEWQKSWKDYNDKHPPKKPKDKKKDPIGVKLMDPVGSTA